MKRNLIGLFLVFSILVSMCFPAYAKNVTQYSDISSGHWAYHSVTEMTRRELFSGTSAPVNGIGVFSPNDAMTCAQFITVLTRYLFPEELNKMSEGSTWYSNSYALALKHGLLTGDELKEGDLSKPCTRQEMAMLLVRSAYLANNEVATNLLPTAKISDYDTISDEYQSYVLQAFSLGLLCGVNERGTFAATNSLTRAQAATVIYRLIDPSTRPIEKNDDDISFTWNNGIVYNGSYSDGEANGFGTMIFPNIGTYTGYFVNGKREGLGTFKWDVGDSYVGHWNSDKMCGEGTYTYSDGYVTSGNWQDNKVVIDYIYVEPSSLKLETGSKENINIFSSPLTIIGKTTWKSSDPSVVSVSGQNNIGTLTAVSAGSATITATTESGKVATCNVSVENGAVEKISLNHGDYTMNCGDKYTLRATIEPKNASQSKIVWSSSDKSIATVSTSGTVSAKSEGCTVISAKSENGLVATCYISVIDKSYDVWSGTWDIYKATSNGTKSSNIKKGTCTIDKDNMTAQISFAPYTGKYIDLTPEGTTLLLGSYDSSTLGYELAFYSISDNRILLEQKTISDNSILNDSISTEYYLLEK